MIYDTSFIGVGQKHRTNTSQMVGKNRTKFTTISSKYASKLQLPNKSLIPRVLSNS